MENKKNFDLVFADFTKQYSFFIKKTINESISKKNEALKGIDIKQSDLMIVEIVKFSGEQLQKIGDKGIETFIDTLKRNKSKKLDEKQVSNIKVYIKKNLKGLAASSRSGLEAFLASKGLTNSFSLDKYWIEKELEGRIHFIVEKLGLEIDKYNLNPEDFLSSVKDKLKYDILKYIIISLISFILGFILGNIN